MSKISNWFKKFIDKPVAEKVIIGLLIAIFIGLVIATISKFSIWFDEAFGAYLIRFNFWDIARYTAADVHPPLFYWLLKLWSLIFGSSDVALRSMSLFFGLVTIGFTYTLVRKLFGKKTAMFSLLLVALSPMLIRYSQEARMYTLVMAIAMASTYVLVLAKESNKRRLWVMYGVLVALGLWTHYFSIVIYIAHWAWRAIDVHKDVIKSKKDKFIKKFFDKNWLLAHGVAIAVFLPWLPFCLIQFFVVEAYGFWISPVTLNTLPNYLSNSFYYLDSNQATGWLALILIIILIFASYLTKRLYDKQSEAGKSKLRLILTLAFVPVVFLFVLSMPPMESYFVDRYLTTSAMMLSVWLAIVIVGNWNTMKTKLKYTLPILVILVFGFGISNVYDLGNFNKNTVDSNNTRDIVEEIMTQSEPGQPIIAANPYFFYEVVDYETDDNPVYFINVESYYGSTKMLENETEHKISDIDEFLSDNPIVWYVGYPGNSELEPPFDCKVVNSISLNDTVTGDPAYKAVQCQNL